VRPLLRPVVLVIAVAMSVYHMWVAAFGPPEAPIFRGTHLLFALTLVFLLYPLVRPAPAADEVRDLESGPAAGARTAGPGWSLALDALLLAASWAVILYVYLNYQYITNRIVYIDELTALDRTMAVLAILVVLEGTRRTIGWALPVTALLFLGYALVWSPVTWTVLLEQMYLSTEGIFGATLGVSASYVMLFVLFGAFMERSGTGQLFMDFSLSLTGHTAGGPGKVAVISSSLFGTVSGSAVANVMVDGPITIPLMKRSGFRPEFAAAVEATASTGGQIMPPVMGAAAFVMAEFLAVPYAQVALWALVPAVLYYVSVFLAVHFEAKRLGLAGVPRAELPRLGRVMLERGHLFAPIVVVLAGLTLGYSAPLSALAGALVCLPVALLRRSTRAGIGWRTVLEALEEGARNTLAVAMACACAGIVIGVVTITGLGITFTQLVVGLAQDLLPLALLLTAVAGIILGMGMPTTPAYIVMVALLVPALIKLGALVPAAHMFAFYFAILSAITPPVALAVYAAATLAKADLWQSGWAAVRVGAAGFIVPFMFVFEPALLLMVKDWSAQWAEVALACATAVLGVTCLAGALHGWFAGRAVLWQRVLLGAAALLLIKPGLVTDLAGAALIAVVLVAQRLWPAAAAAPAGSR
jgi:TRAP transporter 4TM/12TM fusion protein